MKHTPEIEERDREIVSLYVNTHPKLTMQELGMIFGVSGQRIQQILQENGIKGNKKPLGAWSKKLKELSPTIVEMFQTAEGSYDSIRKKFHVSSHSIKRVLDAYGIVRTNCHNPRIRIVEGVKEIQCFRCKEWKIVSEFMKNKNSHGYCLCCHREAAKIYQKNHPKKQHATVRLPI